jgi:CheY-like chemotaxis protein
MDGTAPPAPQGGEPPARPSPGRVLVIEDESAVQAVVRECLSGEGYQVAGASTADEAVAALTHARFDLVLADVVGATGARGWPERWAVLEHLRELAPQTPVVLCTGLREAALGEYAARGFHDLLLKPFGLDELLAVVQRYLPAAKA